MPVYAHGGFLCPLEILACLPFLAGVMPVAFYLYRRVRRIFG